MSVPKHIAEMLQDREDRGDFRDAAARESRRVIGERAHVPVEDLGFSLCYAAGPRGKAFVKQATGSGTIIQAVLVLVALVFFVVAAAAGITWKLELVTGAGVAAAVAGVVGLGLLGVVVAMTATTNTVTTMTQNIKALLPQRQYAPFDAQEGPETYGVSLENHATGDTFHIYSDDLGLLLLDKENRRVIIEGVSHRYVIHAHDFVSVSAYKTDQSSVRSKVLLTYDVGPHRVELQVWMFDLLEGVSAVAVSEEALPRTQKFCGKVYQTLGLTGEMGAKW